MPAKTDPDSPREKAASGMPADVLPARVYWAVALLALAMMAFLYWLTATFNVPLGPV